MELTYTASSGEGVVAILRGIRALGWIFRAAFEQPAIAIGIVVALAVIIGVVYAIRRRS